MSNFIEAIYDEKPCLLNMDYVMDIFPVHDGYKAYTMDFDRGAYLINRNEFNKWRGEENS